MFEKNVIIINPGTMNRKNVNVKLPVFRLFILKKIFLPVSFFITIISAYSQERTSIVPGGNDVINLKKDNTAIIPVPKLENDSYDWWDRHAEVLRIKDSINPEMKSLKG